MSRVGEVAALFLRLGVTSFGGPAAHIAMMEEEIVRRRAWMTREEFLDLLGAAHLLPGPNSTELALHIGYRRAGWAGLLAAGLAFILPAMGIVWMLAWGYVRYGSLPAVGGLLAGVKPVVLAIVVQALWSLGRAAIHSTMTLTLLMASVLALLLGVHELAVLGGAALIALIDRRVTAGGDLWRGGVLLLPVAPVAAAGALAPLTSLFLVFLKAGALLFGSGYVLLAFLRADLVVRLGWLSESQLLDAVAVGQFTPGPIFTTATFVGFIVAGHAGAIVATGGIFLPAFLLVALTAPALQRWSANADLRALLDGAKAASLAMMFLVGAELAREALLPGTPPGRIEIGPSLRSVVPTALFVTSGGLLLRRALNSGWLVLGGAAAGLLLL